MEVGLVALGLGALGYHFNDNKPKLNKQQFIPSKNYSDTSEILNTDNSSDTSEILNTDNSSNGNSIYSQNRLDIANNYVKNKANIHFKKSLNPVDTNVIPPHMNDIPHEELYQNMDNVLKEQAESIYKKSLDSQKNNNFIRNSKNVFNKNNEFFGNVNNNSKPLTHNNMVPFFGGSIKQNTNDFITKTKLENFTGQFENDRKQKIEVANMFKPEKNVSFVNGMPANYDRDRYIPSYKKQGEKLMEEIKVGPGLAIDPDQINSGEGFHPIHRPCYKNIDELKDINEVEKYFDIKPEGNWENKIILREIKPPPNSIIVKLKDLRKQKR